MFLLCMLFDVGSAPFSGNWKFGSSKYYNQAACSRSSG